MEKEIFGSKDPRRERRKFVRVKIYAVTRYFCPVRDMEVGVQTRISDISEGGALLETFMEGIPVEVPVKISFVMPGTEDRLVTLEGLIRHTGLLEKDIYRSGIEFLKIKKKDQGSIREYVASQQKK